jgi:prepilin-type processing-associated H-X9-DG protein
LYEQLDLSAGVAQITKARDHNFSNAVFLCPDERDWANIEHVLLNSSEVKEGVVPPGDYDVANVFPKSTYFGNAGYLQASVGGIDAKFYENVQSRSRIMNSASLGNTGTPTSQAHRYCDQKNFQGVFGQNSRISFRELSDGASNVILVGERYVPRNKSIDAVGSGSWYGVADCTTASGLAMALADTSVPLNAGKSTLAETTGFGSAHAGGAQILLADGSVRFISNSIEIGLYRNLSTIADGMSVPDF